MSEDRIPKYKNSGLKSFYSAPLAHFALFHALCAMRGAPATRNPQPATLNNEPLNL